MEEHTIKLTNQDKSFAIEVMNNINKDYPGQAKVINKRCMITERYWRLCKLRVLKTCKIK